MLLMAGVGEVGGWGEDQGTGDKCAAIVHTVQCAQCVCCPRRLKGFCKNSTLKRSSDNGSTSSRSVRRERYTRARHYCTARVMLLSAQAKGRIFAVTKSPSLTSDVYDLVVNLDPQTVVLTQARDVVVCVAGKRMTHYVYLLTGRKLLTSCLSMAWCARKRRRRSRFLCEHARRGAERCTHPRFRWRCGVPVPTMLDIENDFLCACVFRVCVCRCAYLCVVCICAHSQASLRTYFTSRFGHCAAMRVAFGHNFLFAVATWTLKSRCFVRLWFLRCTST